MTPDPFDSVDWEHDPRSAAAKFFYEGFRAGLAAGAEQYDAALVDALKIAFAGTADVSRADAVSIFLNRFDQAAYRRAWNDLVKAPDALRSQTPGQA